MISITEIVLIVAGFAAIILGYLLPAGKEMDEEEKMLMEKEIRELVRREVEEQKDTIDDMVGDSVENSLDRTERAMERISNEKLSAIGEYSDTVINDIHKNHDEVMFMYDMLNDKHKNLTSVVSEVARKTDEAKQAVRDAEATARDAEATAYKAQEASSAFQAAPVIQPQIQPIVQPQPQIQPIVQPQPQIQPQPVMIENNVRAVLLDEDDDRLSGIRIPYKEKEQQITPQPVVPEDFGQEFRQEVSDIEGQNSQAAPKVINKSGYIDKQNIQELDILEDIPAEVLTNEQITNMHVIGSGNAANNNQSKVVPITESLRVEGKTKNPDTSMKELTANDPVSQNKQIIEMHKAGKSNMVIARELGLGIGEVKLVIDLSNKHRKVR